MMQRHDYLNAYITDLANVIDMGSIRARRSAWEASSPAGGAGVHYWGPIAERYGLNLTVVNEAVDPTFRFMTVDWDGQIRMDPSSPYAMQRLIGLKDRFEIAFACDTDHDRHGIVTRSAGLLPPNHYLSVATAALFGWYPVPPGRPVAATVALDETGRVPAGMVRVAGTLCKTLFIPGYERMPELGVEGLLDRSVRGDEPSVQGVCRSGRISKARVLEGRFPEGWKASVVGRGDGGVPRWDGAAWAEGLVASRISKGTG